MPHDVLHEQGPVFLGSRLKRLGERMQAGAAQVIAEAGLPVQPTHMPLLAALDGGVLTIGQLVQAVGTSQPGVTRAIGQLADLGLVQSGPGDDLRQRLVSLTPAGQAAMARARVHVFPKVAQAVDDLCDGDSAALLQHLARIKAALEAMPLDQRAARANPDVLTLHDYSDALAGAFHDINVEWIETMFRLEPTDREVLENPRERIIAGGGAILFVEARGLGIIGTCALQRTGGNGVELTKMGVRSAARGLKAGEFLLAAAIDRAQTMDAAPLYLLTNRACEAAIHLYEKLGFRHDAAIMETYGARYARCDVAMRHNGPRL